MAEKDLLTKKTSQKIIIRRQRKTLHANSTYPNFNIPEIAKLKTDFKFVCCSRESIKRATFSSKILSLDTIYWSQGRRETKKKKLKTYLLSKI